MRQGIGLQDLRSGSATKHVKDWDGLRDWMIELCRVASVHWQEGISLVSSRSGDDVVVGKDSQLKIL